MTVPWSSAMTRRAAAGSAGLVVLRHGQSSWNDQRRFTGWADPPLSATGRREADAAAAALLVAGLRPELVVTSVLRRAVQTVALLREAGLRADVQQDWRLNERHYGMLEGLTHAEGQARYGSAAVNAWRRSWSHGPPPLPAEDPRWPGADPRYQAVPAQELPVGESLAQTLHRSWPAVQELALPVLSAGGTVLLVGHGNALRALTAHLEQLTEQQVQGLVLPTGVPRSYRWQDGQWSPGPALPVTGTLSGP